MLALSGKHRRLHLLAGSHTSDSGTRIRADSHAPIHLAENGFLAPFSLDLFADSAKKGRKYKTNLSPPLASLVLRNNLYSLPVLRNSRFYRFCAHCSAMARFWLYDL